MRRQASLQVAVSRLDVAVFVRTGIDRAGFEPEMTAQHQILDVEATLAGGAIEHMRRRRTRVGLQLPRHATQ